jgi:hypothetical protein
MNTDAKHREVAAKTKLAPRLLVHSSSTSTIQAPLDQVNVSEWLFTLSDKEYQQCSPAHIALESAVEAHNAEETPLFARSIGAMALSERS